MKIVSERKTRNWPSWDIVYEWEDAIAQNNEWEIKNLFGNKFSSQKFFVRKVMRRLHLASDSFYVSPDKEKWALCWIMDAKYYRLYTRRNIIPVFGDFSKGMVPEIIHATRKLPIFWVTSVDIFKELQKRGVTNVRYIPLSIADKYLENRNRVKEYDVIQLGRKNILLHDFMIRYTKENPNIEYIYQSEDGSRSYISTTRGKIGLIDTREGYIKLLEKCRVSLVSTPGCDNNRNFEGVDFVTPRFFESAAFGCNMIGRYTKNREVEYLGIERVCPFADNYELFCHLLEIQLKTNDVTRYKEFVENNLTSKRAVQLKDEILNI